MTLLILQFSMMFSIGLTFYGWRNIIRQTNRKWIQKKNKDCLEIWRRKSVYLLTKFHELKKERDNLAAALEEEKEKVIQLEKKIETPLPG